MKKKGSIGLWLVAALCAVTALTVPAAVGARAAEGATYTLRDDFGAAPLCRTMSQNMERVELSDAHKPQSRYGYGVRLTRESAGREYLTYDVAGVRQAEISAIVRQSNFGANHGWGLSLGVTDDPTNAPLNNVNNIDLQNIFPMYLSEDGHPFLFTENRWWGYIAAEKYSFAPSTLDIANQLRPFTVPDEVQGVIGEDGFHVEKEGFLYPMINVEYRRADTEEWTPVVCKPDRYRITAATFLGGEKEYGVTVQVRDIPADAVQVRVGADYIRETLKPSAEGDTEADVYETFPIPYDEAIYLTGVKLTLDREYNGGFEQLEQTGIAVDASKGGRRTFGFGESFSADGVRFYDVLGEGVREENFDTGAFTVDSGEYDAYTAGIYRIGVQKGSYTAAYYVEVLRPDELVLDTSALTLSVSDKAKLNPDGLIVTARTNVGGAGTPDYKIGTVPPACYTVDTSAVDYKTAGTYTVTVKVGAGADEVTATFAVTVAKGAGCGGAAVAAGVLPAALALSGAALCLALKKRKQTK